MIGDHSRQRNRWGWAVIGVRWVAGLIILAALGLAVLLATAWIVIILEVVKQRHLQLLRIARHDDVPADMQVIEAWRRRRAAAEAKP